GEENYSRVYAYQNSKLANVLYTKELAKRLKGTGVTAVSLHPGVVATELLRYAPYVNNPIVQTILWPIGYIMVKTSAQGAQTTICCALQDDIPNLSGSYFSDCAVKETSVAAQNDGDAKKLWDLSLKWTGLEKEVKM
ncbi:unnamed protein product, partial [Owenia fusiformis]